MLLQDVQNMSVKDMERTIFQIMTDNDMSEKDANDTIAGMSVTDMERYLVGDTE